MEEPRYEATPTHLEAIRTLIQLGGLAVAVFCGLASANLDLNIDSSLGIVLVEIEHVGVKCPPGSN